MKHREKKQYFLPALEEIKIENCFILCQSETNRGAINDMNVLEEVDGTSIF